MARAIVVKTDKHTQAFELLDFCKAVDDLASIMPASIYNSRMEIAVDLSQRGHIETLGYLYELTVASDPRFDEHASLISRDGWEDDGERGRR